MANPNNPVTIRYSTEDRVDVQRYAEALGYSEGQLSIKCFQAIREMVEQGDKPTLPALVYLIQAALDFEASDPPPVLRKLDKDLKEGYKSGKYKAPSGRAARLNEDPEKYGK